MTNASFFARISRRAVLAAALLAAPVLLQTESAYAATPGETWVAENIQRGLGILNKKQAAAARRVEFESFLLGLIDIKRVGLYTLGAGRRTATPDQIAQFQDAFKDYAESVYESRLLQYSGQMLKVTGSQAGKPGETIVRTVLIDPHNKNDSDPLEVDFRITEAGSSFQVLDASVGGIWLAILEHDDFDSYLGQNNNSVPKLIDHLKALTRDLQK